MRQIISIQYCNPRYTARGCLILWTHSSYPFLPLGLRSFSSTGNREYTAVLIFQQNQNMQDVTAMFQYSSHLFGCGKDVHSRRTWYAVRKLHKQNSLLQQEAKCNRGILLGKIRRRRNRLVRNPHQSLFIFNYDLHLLLIHVKDFCMYNLRRSLAPMRTPCTLST